VPSGWQPPHSAGRDARPADLTCVFGRPLDAAVRQSRSSLYRLLTHVGGDGLDGTALLPGLRATVDQHAAAVRDTLGSGDDPPGLLVLAGYAEGLIDTAAGIGWQPPAGDEVDWSRADWVLLRLRAVCVLACATGEL
jgi:hypothetical protein